MYQFRRLLNILINLTILGVIIFGGYKSFKYLSNPLSIPKETKAPQNVTQENTEPKTEVVTENEEVPKALPGLEGPIQKSFQWKYGGRQYSISKTLYQSIYSFYGGLPKNYTYFYELPPDWEEQYYGMFLAKHEGYDFVKDFLDSLVSQGKSNKLSDDQIVELVISFVQSIPYDDQKASNILSRAGGETMNYPYETLFEDKGVCSDKSFLAISLIRELGYGAAIFIYEGENHMSIGIQCPKEYSNYGSGYCYAETTTVGNKIGIIPELRSYAGSAVGGEEMSYFNESSNGVSQATIRLGTVKILQRTFGKEYGGIVKTIKINNEIVSLKAQLPTLSSNLKSMKTQILELEKVLEGQKASMLTQFAKTGDEEKYNKSLKAFNKAYEEYKDMIDDYNKKVKEYNDKVKRYNYLLSL